MNVQAEETAERENNELDYEENKDAMDIDDDYTDNPCKRRKQRRQQEATVIKRNIR